jgi:hypothetical protein
MIRGDHQSEMNKIIMDPCLKIGRFHTTLKLIFSMKNTLASILTTTLLLFIISCSPLKKYKNSVHGWEADIRKFEQLDSTRQYPDDAILFMGSSSIRLWNTLADDMKPYSVIQRGFGGSKFSDVAWYTPRIVYPHKCQAIVIFVANDIVGSDEDKTPAEVASLFSYTVKTIRKKLPHVPIFYIQVTPTKSRWNVWPAIQEGNTRIKNLTTKLHNVHYIETTNYFLDQEGQPKQELFIKDNLHLNEAGYKVWTGIIKQNLDAVLKKQP